MRAEAEARGDHRFSCTREVTLFRALQKPLPPETVEVEGRWHGGAHYPLMFQMNMASARSTERRQGRNATTYKQCYNMTTTCTVCGKNIQMASLTRHHMQKQHSIYL